jgi:hypothetical protein
MDACAESTVSLIRPEWVPLDEIAKTCADFSVQVSSALALQAIGSAFLALSFETSAHKHYTLASHGVWKLAHSVVAQGTGEAIVDLREACQLWVSSTLWLERFANEEHHEEEMLQTIRDLFGRIREQQHRLWLLLARLQEEQRTGQGDESLVVHLGHLSLSAEAIVAEGGGTTS